jgi:hypothetical protein
MRRTLRSAVLLTALLLGGFARPRAVVRGPVVWLDGAPAWRGAVTSPLVWSADAGAVAFTGRDARGRQALIVILPNDGAPQVLTWPIPNTAQPARAVTWLGPTRIGAGPSVLEPRVVASFTVER